MEKNGCSCNENLQNTVFASSGAADLGEISDLVARSLHRDNIRQLKCLAFIRAGIDEMIDSVRHTDMLVIDGCGLDCGKLTMEKNGLMNFSHLRLTDLGYVKGQTPPSPEVIERVNLEARMIQ